MITETLAQIEYNAMTYYDQLEYIRKCAVEHNYVFQYEIQRYAQQKQVASSKHEALQVKYSNARPETIFSVTKYLERLQYEFYQANSAFLARLACLQQGYQTCLYSLSSDDDNCKLIVSKIEAIRMIYHFLIECEQQDLHASKIKNQAADPNTYSAAANPEIGQVGIKECIYQPQKQLLGVVSAYPAVCPINLAGYELHYECPVYVPRLMFGKSNTEIKFQPIKLAMAKIAHGITGLQQFELNIAWLVLAWFCYKKASAMVTDETSALFDGLQLVYRNESISKTVMVQVFVLDNGGKRSLTDVGVVPITFHFSDPLLPYFDVVHRGARLLTLKIDSKRIHEFTVRALKVLSQVISMKLG